MSCESFRKAFAAWLDDRVPLPDELARHRSECESCRMDTEDLFRIQSSLLGAAGPSPETRDRLDIYAREYERFRMENPLWKDILRVFIWALPAVVLFLLPNFLPENTRILSVSVNVIRPLLMAAGIFFFLMAVVRLHRISLTHR